MGNLEAPVTPEQMLERVPGRTLRVVAEAMSLAFPRPATTAKSLGSEEGRLLIAEQTGKAYAAEWILRFVKSKTPNQEEPE